MTRDGTDVPVENEVAESDALVRHGLVRSRDGRLLAGVAHGLAESWGARPWMVRVGFLAASLLAGLGIVLYAAGWLLMPEEGESKSGAERIVQRFGIQPSWVGLLLLLLGGIVVGLLVGIDGSVLLAGALLVAGYQLYRGDFTVQSTGDEEAAGGDTPRYVYQRQTRRRRPPRPKSYLGRLTIGFVLLVVGIMGALDAARVADPTSRHYAAATLLVIGIGLLVGARFGRSRGLVVLGFLLLPVVAVAAIADYRFGSRWDQVTIAPADVAGLESEYSIQTGSLLLDLTEVDFAGHTLELDLAAGVGNVTVSLPPEVAVNATGRAGLGGVAIEGRSAYGLGASVVNNLQGTTGSLTIDARTRLGGIEIYHDHAPTFEFTPGTGLRELLAPGHSVIVTPGSSVEMANTYRLNGETLTVDLGSLAETAAGMHRLGFVGHGYVLLIAPHDATLHITSSSAFAVDGAVAGEDGGRFQWIEDGAGPTIVVEADGPTLEVERR